MLLSKSRTRLAINWPSVVNRQHRLLLGVGLRAGGTGAHGLHFGASTRTYFTSLKVGGQLPPGPAGASLKEFVPTNILKRIDSGIYYHEQVSYAK